jgi:hypothetical protein
VGTAWKGGQSLPVANLFDAQIRNQPQQCARPRTGEPASRKDDDEIQGHRH